VWDTIVNGFYDDTLVWELCCEVHFETKSLNVLNCLKKNERNKIKTV